MNKRMQAREWKRTEKTRCYTREFKFKLLLYVNDQNVIETRMVVEQVESEKPELNPYQLCGFYSPRYSRASIQYLIPDDASVLDFILNFTRTGKLPNNVKPSQPVPLTNQLSFFGRVHLLGTFVFSYNVNEYQSINEPDTKFPWLGRVWERNTEMTKLQWHDPKYMITWLRNSKALVALPVIKHKIEVGQTNQALRLLSQA